MFIFLTSVNVTNIDFDQSEKLLLSIAEGNSNALAELYTQTQASVYGFALSILKNSHDAEDVLQNCFIQIWNNANSYRANGKPMAWILTITKNLCYMRLREVKKNTLIDEKDELFLSDHIDIALEVEEKVILEATLKVLNEDERQIIMLHAVSGLKFREIAVLLDLATATVLSKYHRAIKKMKIAVGGENNDK